MDILLRKKQNLFYLCLLLLGFILKLVRMPFSSQLPVGLKHTEVPISWNKYKERKPHSLLSSFEQYSNTEKTKETAAKLGTWSLIKIQQPEIFLHRKKSFSIFPSPAGMSLTKLAPGGNNDIRYKLFPPRKSLVSDIPAGDGNIKKLFLRCIALGNNPRLRFSGAWILIRCIIAQYTNRRMKWICLNKSKWLPLLLLLCQHPWWPQAGHSSSWSHNIDPEGQRTCMNIAS